MTKKEMTRIISDETGLTRKDVRTIMESLFDHISAEMGNGGKFIMQGFGTFEAITRIVHYRINGVYYEKRTVIPTFRAGEELKRVCRREK